MCVSVFLFLSCVPLALPPSVPLSPYPVLCFNLQTVRRAQRILHDPHHVVYPVSASHQDAG